VDVTDLTVLDIRPFVPAMDLETSRAFYTSLGWTETWRDASLVLLSLGSSQFVLQDHYVREWAESSMLTVEVVSADDWYRHVSHVLRAGTYGAARVAEPREEGWARVTYVGDPGGVLLHFAQFPPSS
jgi:catechol 2,3-dioxygenase-like lactoylglutathione lyase family enzyme